LTVHPEEERTVCFARSTLKLCFSNNQAVIRECEPVVASRSVNVELGTVLTVWNPAILQGLTVERIAINYRSHRDGVIIDGLIINVGGLLD